MNRLRNFGALLFAAALLAGCGSPSPYRIRDEKVSRMKFLWPVDGTVSSGFGSRSGGRHDGMDIIAPAGTAVRAAEKGTTVHAGSGMRGYGNAVVLDHGDGVTTLYGHLESIRVKSPGVVPAGAILGTVGKSGNATTNHLHFELRVDGVAVDPSMHLSR